MKTKMKILALVLVMAVALTGAGYAAWGSRITANTTLNTGEWDVVLENDVPGHSLVAGDEVDFFANDAVTPSNEEDPIVDNQMPADMSTPINARYDAVDSTKISGARDVHSTNYVYTIAPTINATKDVVTFDFYNLHPGTKAITNYEIRNMGSIPAKIQNITIRYYNENGIELDPSNIADENLQKLYNAIRVSGTLFKHYYSNPPTMTPVTFNSVSLSNLESELEGILVDDDFVLEPKTSADLNYLDSDELEVHNFKFEIPIDSLDGEEGEASSLKIAVEYDFVQYNVMVEEDPAQ